MAAEQCTTYRLGEGDAFHSPKPTSRNVSIWKNLIKLNYNEDQIYKFRNLGF